MPTRQSLVGLRLGDRGNARSIEPISKSAREPRRHVLSDHERSVEVVAQVTKQGDERAWPAGRCSDHDDFGGHPLDDGGLWHTTPRSVTVVIEPDDIGKVVPQRERRELLDDAHFLDELVSQALQWSIPSLWFFDEIDRPEL